MKRIGITIALVCALLVGIPGMASAVGPEDPCWGLKVVDALLVRPPSMVAAVGSTALGLVILPFAWPFGVADDIADDVIAGGWRFALKRPLGDFSD